MTKISVAIAVFSGERYLEEQIDSILMQLEPQDEIVVSYDPSHDKSWEILEKYRETSDQIKIYVNNSPGLSNNFENAMKRCTGDYIFISDQDDRWDAKKRESVVNAFIMNDVDMIIHNGVHTEPNGEISSQPFFSMHRIGPGKIRNILRPRFSGCCIAFKVELLKVMLPIPNSIGAYDHWVGIVGEFFGKIYYLDDILLYHRLHDANVTPRHKRSIFVIIKARASLVHELIGRLKIGKLSR